MQLCRFDSQETSPKFDVSRTPDGGEFISKLRLEAPGGRRGWGLRKRGRAHHCSYENRRAGNIRVAEAGGGRREAEEAQLLEERWRKERQEPS